MRVLVVEDEPDVADVFLDYLLELGHQPTVVRSAEAALGRLRTERPDAIILDINLPGMTGLEFLELHRVRELDVPIVAVSGVASEQQARDCLRLGAVDFVGKPVPLERLGELLEYLAPHAMQFREKEARRPDRRRTPRVAVEILVEVVEYGGARWHATAVSLSAHAVKLRAGRRINPGKAAKLSFTLPDGHALTVTSVLIREDADGGTYFFVNLGTDESRRLRELIARAQH